MQSVLIQQIPVGMMANFSYLIIDAVTKKAAYVDPGWEVEKVLAKANQLGATIDKILITHTHFDHIQELVDAYTKLKVPVFVSALATGTVEEMGIPVHAVVDNDVIPVGNLSVKCLHTPGHTPGEICFYVGKHLITGDVLFVDACGRVDLPDSDPEEMFETLRKLSLLPDETIIYPGHDYGSTPTDTIGHQKKTNPYLIAAVEGKETFFGRRGV